MTWNLSQWLNHIATETGFWGKASQADTQNNMLELCFYRDKAQKVYTKYLQGIRYSMSSTKFENPKNLNINKTVNADEILTFYCTMKCIVQLFHLQI